jgi:hypothetical protein
VKEASSVRSIDDEIIIHWFTKDSLCPIC